MNGSLPPSSSTTFLISLPAMAATDCPAGPDPVSVAAVTRSSRRIASTRAELTSRVWNAPSGKPARANRSCRNSAVCGTFDACLSSPTLPAISAGAAKRMTCQSGKFHGMMASTGPERLVAGVGLPGPDGVRRRRARRPGTRPRDRRSTGRPWRTWPPPARAAASVLPISVVIIAAIWSCSSSRMSAARRIHAGPVVEAGQPVAGVRRRGRGQAALDVRLAHLVKGLHGLPGGGVDGRDRHGSSSVRRAALPPRGLELTVPGRRLPTREPGPDKAVPRALGRGPVRETIRPGSAAPAPAGTDARHVQGHAGPARPGSGWTARTRRLVAIPVTLMTNAMTKMIAAIIASIVSPRPGVTGWAAARYTRSSGSCRSS